ncbi:hypothetical protein E2C01_059392 [Portunus trituberculatus]|uniref:Uncharacterized protein n=1 Tax=Portunus trituberculatus TaxID=210409 RepID=A0A5B7H5Y9_PORTR|nr:hypothetical protein [Portunus trituberculatus]
MVETEHDHTNTTGQAAHLQTSPARTASSTACFPQSPCLPHPHLTLSPTYSTTYLINCSPPPSPPPPPPPPPHFF